MFTSKTLKQAVRGTATLALAWASLAGTQAQADTLHPVLGGGLGAMAGAWIGQSVGGREGAMVGAAVGGVAGVGLASHAQARPREPEPRVVVHPAYRPVPLPAPVYGYRVVERVEYYPAHRHGRPNWQGHAHGQRLHHGDHGRDWERRDDGGPRGGWSRRD